MRFPPPLVYLTALLIGAAIHWLFPVRVLPPSLTGWLGAALVLIAVTLSGLSIREFRRARTTVRPDRPASTLVTTGPFRFSRNPMYVALSLLQVGIGVWMNSAWVVVLVVLAIAWITSRVIMPEERHLVGKFGQPYLDYQRRVRRWL